MRSSASAGAFIIMYSRPRASRTLRSMSTSAPTRSSALDPPVARDEHGLGHEEGGDRPQPVDAQRAAGRDEVDDRIGHAELRRDLDRAADLDHLRLDAGIGQEAGGDARERGRDPAAGQVGRRRRRASRGTASTSEQAPKPSGRIVCSSPPCSATRSAPVMPELDEAVGHVLGDVLGADEQQLDVGVAHAGAQPPLGELELEPGAAQQLDAGCSRRPLFGTASRSGAARHRRRPPASRFWRSRTSR